MFFQVVTRLVVSWIFINREPYQQVMIKDVTSAQSLVVNISFKIISSCSAWR